MLKFILPLAGLALFSSPLFSQTAPAPEETRLLRFPATNGRQVVFSYADQLYTVGIDGGDRPPAHQRAGLCGFPEVFAGRRPARVHGPV